MSFFNQNLTIKDFVKRNAFSFYKVNTYISDQQALDDSFYKKCLFEKLEQLKKWDKLSDQERCCEILQQCYQSLQKSRKSLSQIKPLSDRFDLFIKEIKSLKIDDELRQELISHVNGKKDWQCRSNTQEHNITWLQEYIDRIKNPQTVSQVLYQHRNYIVKDITRYTGKIQEGHHNFLKNALLKSKVEYIIKQNFKEVD